MLNSSGTLIDEERYLPFGGARCSRALAPQIKLKIVAPDDKYEKEADRVADHVMRMAEPTLQRHDVAADDLDEDEEIIQPKMEKLGSPLASPDLAGQLEGLRGRGNNYLEVKGKGEGVIK